MTIQEVEARTGLPRATVRYYEREGLLSPQRLENGYRDYSEDNIATLFRIKLLRELGIALEDIRALQRGEAELPDTLHRRIQTLSLEREDAASAMAACQAIWEAGTTYDTLDGEAYLNRAAWTKAPVLDAPPRIYCPWRRYLARMLDAQLCFLLLFALATLGFHWNIADGGRLGCFILSFLALGLMLLLEPLMLHCFGTTPGKAILGLRVERLDGGRLTYSEAQSRTGQALWRGMGWNLPVLKWIRLYRSYVAHGREGEMSWDRESDFHVEAKPGAWWRNGLYVAAWAAILVLMFGFSVMAGFPPHYDQLTPAEYAENYNFLAEFYGDPRYHLDEAGQWDVPNPLAVSYTDIWAYNTPVVELETDDGSVTALRAQWDFAGESWGARWPDDVMAAMTMAFAAGEGTWSDYWGKLPLYQVLVEKEPFESAERSAFGLQLQWDVVREGYVRAGDMLYPEDGSAAHCTVIFTIRPLQ